MADTKKVFFPNLDGLRFIAFMFVFAEHIIWNCVSELHLEDKPLLNHILYNILCNGEFGVSVFFVLSGFLITYLLLTEMSMNGKLDVKAFYARRFLRIWPLYFAVVIFTFVLFPYVQQLLGIVQQSCAQPWYYFTFLSNFDLINVARNCYGESTMQAGVTWSVAIEEQFYLFWPLLFVILPQRAYKYMFLSLIAVAAVFRIWNFHDAEYIYFHTLGVIGDLALGGLAAYLSFTSSRFISLFREMKPWVTFLIYTVGFAVVITGDYFITHPYYNAVARFFNISYFTFVIMHQNYNETDNFKLGRSGFMSRWGKYTYGLYLLHPLASLCGHIIVKRIFGETSGFLPDLSRAAFILILTFIFAWLSYHYFEKFFLNLKKRFSYIRRE
jgi:peptidoglycan/LPS O-acetylase OafA/YrhL